MSRDVLRRNKSLLKIINDQKSWSKREVKQIREFNGILTARALQQASGDYSDHLSEEALRALPIQGAKVPVILKPD